MHIRAARPEETAALGHIACEAKASWGYSAAQMEAWRHGVTPTADSVRIQPTFVAEVQGQVAGFYQLTAPPLAKLQHLWVRPKFMHQRIGRTLLAHALEYLAPSGITLLEIDADPNAEPFYVACGAVRVSAQPAPIEGEPDRTRPQLRISTERPDGCIER